MFAKDELRHCETCGEVTAQERHRVRGLRLAVVATVVLSAVLIPGPSWMAFAVLGLIVLAIDAKRMNFIRCLRCRSREMERLGRTKPRVGGTSPIDFM